MWQISPCLPTLGALCHSEGRSQASCRKSEARKSSLTGNESVTLKMNVGPNFTVWVSLSWFPFHSHPPPQTPTPMGPKKPLFWPSSAALSAPSLLPQNLGLESCESLHQLSVIQTVFSICVKGFWKRCLDQCLHTHTRACTRDTHAHVYAHTHVPGVCTHTHMHRHDHAQHPPPCTRRMEEVPTAASEWAPPVAVTPAGKDRQPLSVWESDLWTVVTSYVGSMLGVNSPPWDPNLRWDRELSTYRWSHQAPLHRGYSQSVPTASRHQALGPALAAPCLPSSSHSAVCVSASPFHRRETRDSERWSTCLRSHRRL